MGSLRTSAVRMTRRLLHRAYIRIAARFDRAPNAQVLFIISKQRSGSTLLGDLLASVPGVAMTGEVLSVDHPIGLPTHASKSATIRHIADSVACLTGKVRGAKLLIKQMTMHGITIDDLNERFRGVKYIVLYRSSLLEQFVSVQAAQRTGRWIGRAASCRFDEQIEVDPEMLLRHCESSRIKYEALTSVPGLAGRCQVITYESIAADAQGVFNTQIFPWLGIPESLVVTRMMKQVDRPMSEVIRNYREIEPILPQTRLEVRLRQEIGDLGPQK